MTELIIFIYFVVEFSDMSLKENTVTCGVFFVHMLHIAKLMQDEFNLMLFNK